MFGLYLFHKSCKMKITKTIFLFSIIVAAACSSTKATTKATTATGTTTPNQTTPPATSPVPFFLVPKTGTHAPGNEELVAIQKTHKEVTLDLLKKGHAIYTQGACVSCHGAENVYKYSELEWLDLINDMAFRARLSDAEKDAVYKYVLAIKATQPK
jgi:hypothetical protein